MLPDQQLDFEWCYRVVASRDNRFDGWFYLGVTSTGIYCRPSCPARTPLRQHVRFFRTAAAAHAAGFRACRRCRPDAVPGSPEWDVRADLAARAMRLITDGVVDREGVPGLARRLGYTERHLQRLLMSEVGAGPLALARTQRAHAARTLNETTTLPLSQVAYAAGFGSVRQFNDTIRRVYRMPPSALRAAHRPGSGNGGRDPGTVTLRLAYRPPLHTTALLEFLALRAVPGVERCSDGTYQRALRLPHGPATVAVTPEPDTGVITARLRLADLRDLAPAVARCRRLLDLDSDPVAVDAALAADPALADSVAKEPGVRVPRTTEGFEIAVRGIVGQQVSVAGARTVLGRIVAAAYAAEPDLDSDIAHGPPGEAAGDTRPEPPLRPFPSPEALLALPDTAFPMPARRRETIRALATAVTNGELDLDVGGDRAATIDRLRQIPGIGEWTASYIALRGLGDPDAFLPTDLGVRRGAAALGIPDQPTALAEHARRHWAPWRSYALIRLWRHA